MLTTNKFKERVIELGYEIDEVNNEIKIIKLHKSKDYQVLKTGIVHAVVGVEAQYSRTYEYTSKSLKKLVRQYEDTKVKDRSGVYVIPLKGLNLNGQQYLTFNRVSERFKAMDRLNFSDDDVTQQFTKEDLESEFFKEEVGEYLQWAVEA